MKRLTVLAAVLALFGACSSQRSSTGGTTGTTGTTAVTTAVTSTEPTTTAESTASTVASTVASTIPEACLPDGDLLPQSSDDPLLMSGLVGVDIRTGRHPCFERIVVELGGTGDFPGWSVAYVNGPVRLGESDEFVEIAGAATLQVIMRMWMPSMEGEGYGGPIQVFPTNVDHMLELRQNENHEGMCIWSIGLDEEYPFTVNVLHNPERLVIDLYISPKIDT